MFNFCQLEDCRSVSNGLLISHKTNPVLVLLSFCSFYERSGKVIRLHLKVVCVENRFLDSKALSQGDEYQNHEKEFDIMLNLKSSSSALRPQMLSVTVGLENTLALRQFNTGMI